MLTSALITLAKKQFPDWSRIMILEFLNELQTMLFTQNATSHMQMYDITTGKDPILTTTADQYEYDINIVEGFSQNAWRVTKVYTHCITNPKNTLLLDATRSNAAKVIFKCNPGTQEYFIRAYRFPTALTTELVQLEIPEAYHISHLYEGLIGQIEMIRSGKSERWEKFNKILLPEVTKKMSDPSLSFYNVTYKGY